jgi:hypothetical protein
LGSRIRYDVYLPVWAPEYKFDVYHAVWAPEYRCDVFDEGFSLYLGLLLPLPAIVKWLILYNGRKNRFLISKIVPDSIKRKEGKLFMLFEHNFTRLLK